MKQSEVKRFNNLLGTWQAPLSTAYETEISKSSYKDHFYDGALFADFSLAKSP